MDDDMPLTRSKEIGREGVDLWIFYLNMVFVFEVLMIKFVDI